MTAARLSKPSKKSASAALPNENKGLILLTSSLLKHKSVETFQDSLTVYAVKLHHRFSRSPSCDLAMGLRRLQRKSSLITSQVSRTHHMTSNYAEHRAGDNAIVVARNDGLDSGYLEAGGLNKGSIDITGAFEEPWATQHANGSECGHPPGHCTDTLMSE